MSQNIVMISVDSLRADYCPWLADTAHDTRTITDISDSGISFRRAIAPGESTPLTMPQIFTGYNSPTIDETESPANVGQAHYSIPEMLSKEGYYTIGFTPNPFTSREFGFDSGFDVFEDFFNREKSALDYLRNYTRANLKNKFGNAIRLVLNLSGQGDITVQWKDYYSEILDEVDKAEEPFFLWVFLLEPHWPYFPSRTNRENVSCRDLLTNYKRSRVSDSEMTDDDGRTLLKLYRNTIKDVDDFVNQIQADLAEYDPYYVFHADHGESFGEHGNWGHQGDLHEENIHVPLEVWGTDLSAEVSSPVSTKQIPAIIQALASDRPEDILEISSPFATARNRDNDISVGLSESIHYPVGNKQIAGETGDIVENIRQKEKIRVKEEQLIRKSSVDLSNKSL